MVGVHEAKLIEFNIIKPPAIAYKIDFGYKYQNQKEYIFLPKILNQNIHNRHGVDGVIYEKKDMSLENLLSSYELFAKALIKTR